MYKLTRFKVMNVRGVRSNVMVKLLVKDAET
jgi:hypothetical protein